MTQISRFGNGQEKGPGYVPRPGGAALERVVG